MSDSKKKKSTSSSDEYTPPPKGRTFNLLLYPDNPIHFKFVTVDLPLIRDCRYSYILHDSDSIDSYEDVTDLGDGLYTVTYRDDDDNIKSSSFVLRDGHYFKKSHWHIVIQLDSKRSPRSASGFAREFHLEKNLCQLCGSLEGSLFYLIHYYDSDKYQYSIDSVQGNLKEKLIECIQKVSTFDTESSFNVLLDYIQNSDFIILTDFLRYACNNGLLVTYRKFANGFHRAIDQHNIIFSNNGQSDIL